MSLALQASSSEVVVSSTSSGDSARFGPSLDITSAGSFPAVRATACPARLQPLLAALFPHRPPDPQPEQGVPAEDAARLLHSSTAPGHAHAMDLGSQRSGPEKEEQQVQQAEQGPAPGQLDWRCTWSAAAPWLLQLVDEAGYCLLGLRMGGAAAQVSITGSQIFSGCCPTPVTAWGCLA